MLNFTVCKWRVDSERITEQKNVTNKQENIVDSAPKQNYPSIHPSLFCGTYPLQGHRKPVPGDSGHKVRDFLDRVPVIHQNV